LDPQYAAALYNLGWLAQADRAFDAARKYYGLAIQAEPKTWQAHLNLGNIAVLQGNYQEAMREFRETIRLRPDSPPAQLDLATLQLKTGDIRGALGTLQHLKQSRWDLLEARYLNAVALLRVGRFADAEAELTFISERDSQGLYRDRIADLRGRIPGRMDR
jgi:tetratricopeptide (TPR) repeat protein